MNFHSDFQIMRGVSAHWDEARTLFPENRIVGIFYQGSGNYGLDYEGSDVDTKLIVLPSLRDAVLEKPPVSELHCRQNGEHIDCKDIRVFLQCVRKQNINISEILFTKYRILNPLYEKEWAMLEEKREMIARSSPIRAVLAFRGIAKEKYFAMEHRYPSRTEWIDRFGYDPKQLHHLLRYDEFIERFIRGEKISDCLTSRNPEYLIAVKRGLYPLEKARKCAEAADRHIDETVPAFTKGEHPEKNMEESAEKLLEDFQYRIMKKSLKAEL